MKIVTYLDNDQLNKPNSKNAKAHGVGAANSSPITKEKLIQKYPDVFAEEIGLLEGVYHIQLDPQIKPVQHVPRRVPVSYRDKPKQTLNDLVKQEVLTPVTKLTEWVSSMVAVPKQDGRIRLCLDPKELNKVIQREHYPLPTVEGSCYKSPGH